MSESKLIEVEIDHESASKRTRRAVKGAPIFRLCRVGEGQRRDEILVRNIATGWFGWLPINEVRFSNYNGPLSEGDFNAQK